MRHLLGISHGVTPDVRQRMALCVALLGSFEEAAAMLATEGFGVCVNTLRKVAAGMGALLSRRKHGEIRSVVTSIEELTERRQTKDQTTWLNDFIDDGLTHGRMDYASSTSSGSPITGNAGTTGNPPDMHCRRCRDCQRCQEISIAGDTGSSHSPGHTEHHCRPAALPALQQYGFLRFLNRCSEFGKKLAVKP